MQDHSFKLLLQLSDKDSIMAVAKNLNSNSIWFEFSIVNKTCATTNKQKKDYCKYDSKDRIMLYKDIRIDYISEIKIVDLFMEYFKYIVKNKDILTERFLY